MRTPKPVDMKRKPVAFNIADEHQRRLYEHATKGTNFSAYIKSLIQRDMDANASKPAEVSGHSG